MNKLKEVYAYQSDEIESLVGNANGNSYYLKSEADKVIAEKDKEIARLGDLAHAHNIELLRKENLIEELKHQRDGAFGLTNSGLTLDDLSQMAKKEIDRQKYKRCLAMARWCFTKSNYHFVLARHGEDAQENNRRSVLYSKWNKRWLAIAEKFKEGVNARTESVYCNV